MSIYYLKKANQFYGGRQIRNPNFFQIRQTPSPSATVRSKLLLKRSDDVSRRCWPASSDFSRNHYFV